MYPKSMRTDRFIALYFEKRARIATNICRIAALLGGGHTLHREQVPATIWALGWGAAASNWAERQASCSTGSGSRHCSFVSATSRYSAPSRSDRRPRPVRSAGPEDGTSRPGRLCERSRASMLPNDSVHIACSHGRSPSPGFSHAESTLGHRDLRQQTGVYVPRRLNSTGR